MVDRQAKAVPQSEVVPTSPQGHSVFDQRGFGDLSESLSSTGSTYQSHTPALQAQLDRSARLGHHFSGVDSTPSPLVQPKLSLFQDRPPEQDPNRSRSTPEISFSGGGSAIQRQLAQVLQGRRSGQGGSSRETSTGSLGSRTLRLGDPMMRGEDVRQLQEKLIALGHSVGSSGADGVFGRDTEAAVRAFQSSQGIEVDGVAGPETFGRLTESTPDDPQQQEDTPDERETDTSQPESESEDPSTPALEIPSEDVDIMARTLYGEARGENSEGKAAVGWVIRNRAARPAWPSGIAAVCQQPWQFSCWNAGDPNLPQLRSVTTANPVFAECVEIANQVVSGSIPDVTNGADHYYANYISPPNWAKGETPVAQIGVHLFFNLTGTQQPATQDPTETDQTGDESSAGERTLRLSDPPMRGDDVRQVQEQLIGLGHSVGRYGADGVFGQSTYEAVMAFQRSQGIEVDGVVGPQTREQLNSPNPQPEETTEDPTTEDPSGETQTPEESEGEQTEYGTRLPNGDIQFTENFRLSEFTKSATADRLGLNNEVPENLLKNLYALCVNVLQPLRDAMGPITITSGYRSPAVNEEVGGSSTSQHMAGEAADLVVPGKSVRQVCNYIDRNLPHDQLIYEFGSWTHVSYTSSGNRYQYFDIT